VVFPACLQRFRQKSDFEKILRIVFRLRYCGCARYLHRGIAYAIGAIEDRADKGNLMYQSELISFKSEGRGRVPGVRIARCTNCELQVMNPTIASGGSWAPNNGRIASTRTGPKAKSFLSGAATAFSSPPLARGDARVE
jgi:hypothetical protein